MHKFKFPACIIRTKTFTGTWCGRKATNTTYHFDKSTLGKRVDVQAWEDTGEVVVRAIHGDGRGANFTEFCKHTFAAGEAKHSDFAALAKELADIYFVAR